VCRRFGLTILSPFWLSPFWLVAVIVCRRFDGTPGQEFGLVPVFRIFLNARNSKQEVGVANKNGVTEVRTENSTWSIHFPPTRTKNNTDPEGVPKT